MSDEDEHAEGTGQGKFHQVPLSARLRGNTRPVAQLRLEPADFEARFGLHFEEDVDGLDYFKAAMIDFPSAHRMLLICHLRNPAPGIVVWASATLSPAGARAELLAAFGLTDEDVWWRPEDEVNPMA